MEDYLTVDELSAKIKYSKQSLYNLIYKKNFILGKHYFKPTPKKILFKWSEIKSWVEGPTDSNAEPSAHRSESHTTENTPNSSINI